MLLYRLSDSETTDHAWVAVFIAHAAVMLIALFTAVRERDARLESAEKQEEVMQQQLNNALEAERTKNALEQAPNKVPDIPFRN